ncbi:MAG: type II secretion system protein GspF [Deltaproteobacteria bacterium RBG_13_65_10]|nr:MAG: type II secretion system protein GspF [Deltaproteobacteria bacterium RBG_13_65_10]
MAVFVYKGLDAAGNNTSGIIDADSPKLARMKLRKTGIFPTDLTEEHRERSAASVGEAVGEVFRKQFSFRQLLTRVTETDKAIVTRQLATLLGAGIPVVEALTALIDQVENPAIQVALGQVRQRVNEGASLADAMAQHPKVFSTLYVNMIRAGEAGGALEVVLERLADYLESQVRLRNRVSAAMVYPIVMSCMALIFIGVLVTFVVPKLTEIFKSLNQPLPLATVVLIKVSDFMKVWWWAVLVLLIAAWFGFRRWKASEKGRPAWDAFLLRTPVVGRLVRTISVARFSKTLATLLSSGIPLIRSLEIVRNIMDNAVLEKALERARESITEGASIAQPLRRSGQFPPLLTHMIAIGEKSGELEAMLGKVAEAYDNEVETSIAKMTSWLEPVMILVMAGIVGLIIISILIPIFNINQVIA